MTIQVDNVATPDDVTRSAGASPADVQRVLDRLGDLPKGTELERAALGQLHELAREAWVARARGGAEDFRRAWAAGLLDIFDELEIAAGRVEARAAFDWAIGRLDAITAAVTGGREPTDAA